MKKGFTLAEVLITLGIIGVVAAMTIPTLMNATNSKETVTALKKAYSAFSQAYTIAVQENGTPDEWSSDKADTSKTANDFLNILTSKMKVIKKCGVTTDQDCYSYNWDTNLAGVQENVINTNPSYAKATLADGSFIFIRTDLPNCNGVIANMPNLNTYCGYISIDTNGSKKPNKIGMDVFRFYIMKTGIVPYGLQADTHYSFTDTCNKTASDAGYGCTAWVIYNENTDYLKCVSDLSWTGKTKCN